MSRLPIGVYVDDQLLEYPLLFVPITCNFPADAVVLKCRHYYF